MLIRVRARMMQSDVSFGPIEASEAVYVRNTAEADESSTTGNILWNVTTIFISSFWRECYGNSQDTL
jgi:hypothetical protein